MDSIGGVCAVWSLAFATHLLRYVIAAGGMEAAIRHVGALRARPIHAAPPAPAQMRMEFWASLEAGAIFALLMFPMLYGISAGYTKVYFDFEQYGPVYPLASFALAVLLHDAYFYWTHRWMHRPGVFRVVHAHHHRSRNPSSWAAFSFHPLESLVQGGI